ncbi:MAG: hypothetical protein HY782_08820 [Chloroflexi bacterium]|nr:hypothetical protein [Chloroflexota bacterium]
MTTARGYLDDPFRFEFDADVIGKVTLPDGRQGVLLAETYFYPTGGGQEHDTGMLGEAQVVDVFVDDAGNVVHVVDGEVTGRQVPAKIDRERRFGFLQQHSAQHLLSAVLEDMEGLETISAKISIDSPTTIDVPLANLGEHDWLRVQDRANALIYADRQIKSYFIREPEIATVPFRRPPKVSGQIRVVEIDGVDYSACGGTHCTRTGMIGVLKILKSERRADKLRVYFVAGRQALSYFQNYYAILTQVARQLNTNPEAVAQNVQRQQEQLRAAQVELEALAAERLPLEAKRLVATAEPFESIKLVIATFPDRTAQQLRALAGLLQNEPGMVALLATYDGMKLALAVACAADTAVSASELLRKHLSQIGGRGGGDARLAQGGGAATEEQWQAFFANTRKFIRESRESRE